jgi:hypothetical protein
VPRNIADLPELSGYGKRPRHRSRRSRADQPKDKERAQKAGIKEQREAAEKQPQSPGEPASGE